jgi:phenylpropionate dioxygenase-like ring-hydroxylating dioxygenase large terminal subunit
MHAHGVDDNGRSTPAEAAPPPTRRAFAGTVAGVGPVGFPAVPVGWYHLCRSRELSHGPVGMDLGGRRYVGFRDASGRAVVLDARCSHMRADLSRGDVVAGRIRCPLHAWEYAGDGRCVHVPATANIPPFACQLAYAAAEFGGHVAFCNAPAVPFPMPFYDGRTPADLVPAAPFDMVVRIPWHMVAANGFDIQHFRVAHDRTLAAAPVVDEPASFARRITAEFEVTGTGPRDRLTRRFSGPRVRMSVTVWGGTNVLVAAEFRRTTSYGMVFVRPLDAERTHLRTIVWVPRRRGALRRALLDPLDAAVRRSFIRAFMGDDAARSEGVGYNPATLIDADKELRDYFLWLGGVTNRT